MSLEYQESHFFPQQYIYFKQGETNHNLILNMVSNHKHSFSISLQNVDIYNSVFWPLGYAKVMPSDKKQLNFSEEEVRN